MCACKFSATEINLLLVKYFCQDSKYKKSFKVIQKPEQEYSLNLLLELMTLEH